ncbi:MAG: DNA primase [Candidatus Omnitrophota bacterium]
MANDLEGIIEQIHSKLNIADIIGAYIPLKQAGRNFKACCPFHHEKTASFVVSPVKGIYHCFGCGAGGDMISFVMKHEGLEFMEALRLLADKAGIALSGIKGNYRHGSPAGRSSAGLYRVNQLAVEYYNAVLLASAKAAAGREYLARRGLNAESVGFFKIGYASGEWDGLLKYAKSKGVSESVLQKAGLVMPGKNNGFYDRFRARAIFPIFDMRSRVVAFGGRTLDDSLPKYMNSPESEIYVKGRHLYGLNLAIDEIRKKDYVIIVEGYLDLILPFQNGIKNIVATLGTALTIEQIRLIKRFTENAVIVYDADAAGEAASLRGLDLLVSEGLFVRVATLDKGDDPDSYVRRQGAEGLIKIVDSAPNLFDYKLTLLLNKYNPAHSEDKARITAEMLPTIKRIENSVLRSDYIKRLSKTLFVQEDVLLDELSKIKSDYSSISESKSAISVNRIPPAEKIIINLMMEEEAIARNVRTVLDIEEFASADIRRIVDVIYRLLDENKIPSGRKVIERIGDEGLSSIIYEAFEESEKLVDRRKTLHDCVVRVKRDCLARKEQTLTTMIKQAESAGDDDKLMKLIKQLDALSSERI